MNKLNSLTFKLAGIVIGIIVVMNLILSYMSNVQTTEIIDQHQSALFSERLGSIQTLLANRYTALESTLNVEAYEEDFKNAAIQSLEQIYYLQSTLSVYPFILDQNGVVVMHPTLNRGDNSLASQDYVQQMLERKEGNFNYTVGNEEYWLIFSHFENWHWTIAFTIPTVEKYAEASAATRRLQMTQVVFTLMAMAIVAFTIYLATRPIIDLTNAAGAVAAGDLNHSVRVRGGDEIGRLGQSFNTMTAQLRSLVGSLEQRVSERTRALELSGEVSRRLVTILDPDELVRAVVDQIQSAFNYYHVHIYLFDDANANLVMAGGTGEVGRVMLVQGHRIQRGKGLVGRAAETNRAVLVENTSADPNWLPNPLLPETKAEVAVPIALGDRVLGVLDVQQDQVGGLGQVDVDLIQSLANQIAVALQNAQAYFHVQQQAEREAMVSAVSQKIQRASTVEEALQVAVSELGQALNARVARVELHPKAASGVNQN